MTLIDDTFLLGELKDNSYDAFNTVYNKYWENLFGFCLKYTKNKEAAERIVQDIFIQLWERRQDTEINNLKSYLYQSVKFSAFQLYKQNKFHVELFNLEFEDYIIDNLEDIQEDLNSILSEALGKLPEKRKEVLMLNKFQNLSISEISDELNLSNQTVKNHLSLAVSQLRELLKSSTYQQVLILFLLSK